MRRALVVSALALLSACTRGLDDFEPMQLDHSGVVRITLEGHASDGTPYVLRDSTLEISGSALLTLASRASDEALSTPLPSGAYSLYLRPGYRVLKLDAEGAHPVQAELATGNPLRFALAPREDATIPLVFNVEGERVVFGTRGDLRLTGLLPR
jgi:hypothetical protein